MDRRRFLVSSCCALVPFVSGCLNDPGRDGGLLEVLEAEKPPNATVTSASDDRLQGLTPVRTGLRQAHTGNGVADIEVSHREFDAVAQTLEALPWYDRTAHNGVCRCTHSILLGLKLH